MKFIVMQVWIDTEGKIGTPVQNFDNEDEAWSRYHGILSQAAKSSYPKHGAIIMNEDLFELEHKVFTHDIQPEPEPEPEEDVTTPE